MGFLFVICILSNLPEKKVRVENGDPRRKMKYSGLESNVLVELDFEGLKIVGLGIDRTMREVRVYRSHCGISKCNRLKKYNSRKLF